MGAEAMQDRQAGAGVTARRRTIGVLAEHVLDEYQNTVLFGAADELREQGASVVLFCGGVLNAPDPASAQRNALYELVEPARLDALIVLSPLGNHVGTSALETWCARFEPLPICTLSVALPDRPSVLVDDAAAMRRLVQHLIDTHGARRIAFVRGPEGNEEAERRYAVFRETVLDAELAFDPELVTVGDFNAPSGAEAVRLLCDERRVSFDALVAANDYMALGAMEALQARGIDVPRRVAVAGFDDIDEARFATPPLTTVRQPLYDSGRQAGRIALALVRGETAPERVVLDTLLVLRESCGCTVDHGVAPEPIVEFRVVRSLAAHLSSKREETAAALARAVSPEHARIAPDWGGTLFDAFAADVGDHAGDRFVAELEAILRRVVAAGGSIRPWHAVISILSNVTMETSGDSAAVYRADDVLHRARVLIGDLRERVQAQHRIRRERWIRTLHETSEALMSVFGADALVDAVAKQLPRLQIPACVLAVYESPAPSVATSTSRAIFLWDEDRNAAADGEHPRFRSRDLAPAGWLDARPRTVVAEPLVFHGEQLGFALFEVGPREGVVYEGLRELVSSAMKGARLVEQVVEEATRRQRAERERLEKEMEIAARIQTTIVPKTIDVPGLDVAVAMIPATEVGGDYYDVVPYDGGCWFGIGDVAGHGLQTGLVMLMIQSVVAALVRRNPLAAPGDVLAVLNAVMHDNVHRRMHQDEHATLTLLRYDGGGRFVYAGAHEDIIVHRGSRGPCECLETRGPWVGAFPDVRRMLVETSLRVEVGDLVVLYTDGITEAKDGRGVQFGLERVCAIVERLADRPVEVIRDQLIEAVRSWTAAQEDDMSVVVVRRLK
jgi:DNA-binding LacI/PurR family transcriptional regulator/serine phosphatase RsbU (regulator of sigma subunit)